MKFYRLSLLGLLLASICLISSCASSYRPINANNLNYASSESGSDVKISYRTGVLTASSNKKYAKRELKKGMNVVAIKITNNSDKSIDFSDQVKIYNGDQRVFPVAPSIIKSALKQPSAIYLLYSLIVLYTETCNGFDCNRSTYPVGIPISIGNIAVSGSANAKFLANLEDYNLLGKTIQPGETAYGLIGLTSISSGLKFEVE